MSMTPIKRYALVIIPIALILKFAAIFVWTVHFDTNYYLNIGSNFIERGSLTPYMWRIPADANIVAGSGTGYGVLVQTLWLKTFGLTLVSGRILTYLWGALALIPMYFSVRRLYNADSALLTVMLAAASVSFLVLLTMRMDAAGIFFYSLTLCAHIYGVYGKKWWLHSLAGVLAIVSAEFHILGTVYLFGIAFYYFVDFIRVWQQTHRIPFTHGAIFYYAGAGIAGLAYIYFRILPNPEHYFLIPRLCPFCGSASVGREAVRYVVALAWRPVEAILLLFAVRTAIARRAPQDIHYLLLLTGCVLAMGFISPLPLPIYTSHLWAVMMLGTGVAITRGHGKKNTLPQWRLRSVGGLAAVVLIAYAGFLVFLGTRPQVDDPRIAYIRANIPTNAVIAGNDDLYHQLIEYSNYLSNGEEFGLIVGTTIRGETGADLWEREQPIAIMIDYENASSVSEPEHIDSLRAYIDKHSLTEVVAGLWVDLDTIDKEAVSND